MNPIERVIAIFSTQIALSRKVPCSPQEISRWNAAGKVPRKRAPAVAKAALEEIPAALARGIDPDIARPVSVEALVKGFEQPVGQPHEKSAQATASDQGYG